MQWFSWVVILSLTLTCPMPVLRGEVKDSSPAGFVVHQQIQVAASPARVYGVLVKEVGKWWSSDHTFSGNSENLSIEDRPQGCFCERFPSGGGVRHMTVVYADPGKALRMEGGLGPLQELGVTGALTFTFKASDGTTLNLDYRVAGYAGADLGNAWAAPVDQVLAHQLERLKRYVETGSAVK